VKDVDALFLEVVLVLLVELPRPSVEIVLQK
jgi:hypothetical protein